MSVGGVFKPTNDSPLHYDCYCRELTRSDGMLNRSHRLMQVFDNLTKDKL